MTTPPPLISYPIWMGRNFIINKKLCFLVMPFRENWSDTIFGYIKDIVTKFDLEVKRADSISGHIIMEDIWRLINEAIIVIVDVSSTNPNVFYELGIAHTLGKQVILLAQSTEHIPFDISPYRCIIYRNDASAYQTLKDKLPDFIECILDNHPTGDIFIDKLINKMKIWKQSFYDYDQLMSISKLYTLRVYSDIEQFPEELLVYCLASSVYHGYYEDIPFWIKLTKHSIFAGEVLGRYIIMPYRRVRYRAAYILQFMADNVKQRAINLIRKESKRTDIADAINMCQVKKFISSKKGRLSDLPTNYGEQLLIEFDWIEKSISKLY